MNVVFNLYHFGIKVMAPFISDNFLLGGIIFFQIGRFLVFLMLRGKIRVSLATFNENYPNSVSFVWTVVLGIVML